jgi:alpha-tubulin suppressor-like RCC1 family protein
MPVDVSGLSSGVSQISAGGYHTCALMTTGGVKCWGLNSDGQLGDDTHTTRKTPVDVCATAGCATLLNSGVQMVSAGWYHTCAVVWGGAQCWGNGDYGALGDGTTTDHNLPANVTGLTNGVVKVASTYYYACALTFSGGVKCWGRNWNGELGDGTQTNRLTPVDVSGLTSGVSQIGPGGLHTCAVTSNGGAKCWGYNSFGDLGDGTTTRRLTPVDVDGLSSGVAEVAAGYHHSCARMSQGRVKCWGRNNSGQLGNGTTSNSTTPVNVSGFSNVTFTPTPTAIVVNAQKLDAGANHTCVVTTGGGVKCWGANGNGELGDSTTTHRSVPVDVSNLTSGIKAISAGHNHTCAVTNGGEVKCWGSNFYGELGDGTTVQRLVPVDVTGSSTAIETVSTGTYFTCGLTTGGGVKCWGWNGNGQLGDGTTTNRQTPVDVVGLTSGVAAISVGHGHACALTNGGAVKCWGDNLLGALGDGTQTDSATPVDVVGLASGVVALSAGNASSCAITNSGGMKCWGQNAEGQLGDGTQTFRLTPVDVVGLSSSPIAMSQGLLHTCALTSGGGVKCWGANDLGQLGDGTVSDNRITPGDVNGLTSGIEALAAGGAYVCALTLNGGIKCWGSNHGGELGNGGVGFLSPVPVDVIGFGGVLPTATSTPTLTPTITPTHDPNASPTATFTVTATTTPTTTPTDPCNQKPAKPKLKSPADAAAVTAARPTLKWKTANCADTYNVTVKDAATGKKVDGATGLPPTQLQYKTKKLTKGKTYSWFVQACNNIGCTKSATWKFTVN